MTQEITLRRLPRHGRGHSSALRAGVASLLPTEVAFPVRAGDAGDPDLNASILDAFGVEVATVDPHRQRFSDEAAHNVAHVICLALNTAAGHDTAPQLTPL